MGGGLQPLEVAVFWPSQSVGRDCRGKPVLCGPGGFSAHAEQSLQLRSEAVIEPAVDEGVVAGAAHCKPVEGEVQGVVGVDGLAGEEDDVAIQGEPANCEEDDNEHQHLDGLLVLFAKDEVLLSGDVPDDIAQPELLGHRHVGSRDDQKGQDIEQNEGC